MHEQIVKTLIDDADFLETFHSGMGKISSDIREAANTLDIAGKTWDLFSGLTIARIYEIVRAEYDGRLVITTEVRK